MRPTSPEYKGQDRRAGRSDCLTGGHDPGLLDTSKSNRGSRRNRVRPARVYTCVSKPPTELNRLSRWAPVFMIAIGLALAVSRDPNALLLPQFWAEDGRVFYADTINLGPVHALFMPHNGYFHLVPRSAAIIASLLPMNVAPLVFNLIAIAASLAPAAFVASTRLAHLLPSTRLRLAMALALIAAPNASEVRTHVTNGQFELQILAVLVLVARWRGPASPVFDRAALAIGAFSGPFVIFYAPLFVVEWLLRPASRDRVLAAIVGVAFLVQAASVLITAPTLRGQAIGASPELGAALVGGKIVAVTFLGTSAYEHLYASGATWILALLALAAGVTLALGLAKGSPELRLFILYAGAATTASLLLPATGAIGQPAWTVLADPHNATRYYLPASLALLATLIACLASKWTTAARTVSGLTLACAALVACPTDWKDPPLADLRFSAWVEQYDQAPPGSIVRIPINPPGWTMTLHKPA
ncbi:MAG: hypothetical protein HW416_1629 [Chloroflexi bacterium]|nr:hypothetical protein [Chloroflexota bacterium]